MNKLFRVIGLALLISIVPQLSFAGGGWVKTKGFGYYKIGQSWTTSTGYFKNDGLFSPGLNSSLLTTSLYAEHGLGDYVSLEGYIPIYTRHSVEGTIIEDMESSKFSDAVGGIGDINVGLRFQLLKKDFIAISGTATLGLPIGKPGLGEQENLFTGDGELNQTARIDVSAPFGSEKFGGYGTAYVGYNNRTAPFTSELLYGFETGVSAMESRVWLIGRLIAVNAGGSSSTNAISDGFSSSASFTNFMVETAFRFDDRYGFSASYTGSVSGNILLVAPSVGFGLYMDIK